MLVPTDIHLDLELPAQARQIDSEIFQIQSSLQNN